VKAVLPQNPGSVRSRGPEAAMGLEYVAPGSQRFNEEATLKEIRNTTVAPWCGGGGRTGGKTKIKLRGDK